MKNPFINIVRGIATRRTANKCGNSVTIMFRNLAIAGTAAMSLALTQLPASAEILYGTTGSGGVASSLYTIDTTTGVATLVGATGFNHVASIDFDPLTGVLYGISNESTKTLITIDTATGAGTAVVSVPDSNNWPDMSFDSAGILYTWSEPSPDNLNTVNLITGATTEIGASGVGTGQTGLDVDSTDTIYMKDFDDIYTVSATTGAATFMVNLDRGFDNILAFDAADTAYTLMRNSSGGASTDSDLYTIDLTSGVSTLIGATGVGPMAALAFSPAQASSLYGVTGDGASTPETLFLLDKNTAAETFVLTLGNGDDGEAIGFNPTDGLIYHASGLSTVIFERIDAAFTGTTDIPIGGDLNAEPQAITWDASRGEFLWAERGGQFLSVDATTGAETVIGALVGHVSKGLAFVGATLYSADPFSDQLRTINPANGATLSSTTITLAGHSVFGANALATDPDTGTLYAIIKTVEGFPGSAQTRRLVTINTASAVATDIGELASGLAIAGLAFVPGAAMVDTSVTVDDGCDVGGAGNDVDTVVADSDGTIIYVSVTLCAAIDDQVKYRVHFDYTDQSDGVGNNNPDTPTNAGCVTTSDDGMKLRGNKETGPGVITPDTTVVEYEVYYSELSKNGVFLVGGDQVLIWIDTQFKGINDRAPNVESGDSCSKPQFIGEVMDLTLN